MKSFCIIAKDAETRARAGILTTPHGRVETPSYVIVGTRGEVKCLKSRDIKLTKTQLIIANTFHLWPEAKRITRQELATRKTFLIQKLRTTIPTMTDSGGFQVLSLAFSKNNHVGKFWGDLPNNKSKNTEYRRRNVHISRRGINFIFEGKKMFLSPRISMDIQRKIGADITFALDHITSPLDSYAYNKKAIELTDLWAKDCLKIHTEKGANKHGAKQLIFGIVQGGIFKDLRIKSAKNIGTMPFDGFGIGGSYTKKQISKILKWIIPHLPEEKPRHLLGVGKIQDIFEAVENGIDTFDCVIPTREARHARIYSGKDAYDIRKSIYKNDRSRLAPRCKCPTCVKGITRAKLHGFFRVKSPKAPHYATLHNVWFFNTIMERIRHSIKNDSFVELKKLFA